MAVRPLNDCFLLLRDTKHEKNQHGLVYDPYKRKYAPGGVVVAVGPGKRDDRGNLIPPKIKPGNRVVVDQQPGIPVKVDGVEYLFFRERQVLLVEDSQ
jgi:chaperonin GroES